MKNYISKTVIALLMLLATSKYSYGQGLAYCEVERNINMTMAQMNYESDRNQCLNEYFLWWQENAYDIMFSNDEPLSYYFYYFWLQRNAQDRFESCLVSSRTNFDLQLRVAISLFCACIQSVPGLEPRMFGC